MQSLILSLDTVLVCTAAEQITQNLAAHSSKHGLSLAVSQGQEARAGSGVLLAQASLKVAIKFPARAAWSEGWLGWRTRRKHGSPTGLLKEARFPSWLVPGALSP